MLVCILHAPQFTQGDEDKVVPPEQAEVMWQALKQQGIKTTLMMYKVCVWITRLPAFGICWHLACVVRTAHKLAGMDD